MEKALNESIDRLTERYLKVMESWGNDWDLEDYNLEDAENDIRNHPYVAIGELLDIIENL